MWDNVRADVTELARAKGLALWRAALEACLLDNGFQAVLCHRLARRLRDAGVPILGHLVARLGVLLTSAEISPNATIGPGFRLSHGMGLVIGGGVRLGARVHLHHNVTLGARNPHRLGSMPTVGDDVFVGTGATILGEVVIGDRAVIGAQSLVLTDVPAGALVTAPASEVRAATVRV